MPFNVPEEEKPAFNKKVQESLGLLAQDIGETLSRVQSLQPQTLVDAYNQPVQAPVTRDLTPLEQYVYEPQPVQEVADLAEPPTRESMVAPQEQPQVLSSFRNQANAQFGGDMVSITPEQQASTDIIGAEIDSLRNDAGEIASSPLEVFSKPLDANKVKALGFVDSDGNVTEKGELFFNLKESGVFNEDGTINDKGQAYLIPRSEIGKPENVKAFKTWYDDNLDYQESTGGEMIDAVVGFGKNILGGLYNSYKLSKKLTSLSGLYDVAKKTPAGKETIAELQVDQIANLEQIAKNFQAVGGYADIIQGLTGKALYEGASAATGVPMQDMKNAAEENLYLARQRQWQANENLRDLEVGSIAEAMTGLDGIVKVAKDAKNILGDEKFNQRYTGASAVAELVADPSNLIPAGTAFKVAESAPIASRAILKAQQILGNTAKIEKALNEAQTIVEAGNAILKKEAVAVPLAQRLFTDISARAGANPELLARSQQAMNVAQRITASADEVRAAMPSAIASVEQLAAKRASLATRIPEEYAKRVVQTAELGAKVRAMPANVIGSIFERTGDNISKIDNAVTGYLSERGLDQAYNAALGAAGVVGLAGNPIVGAIGAGAAALKTGKFLTEYGKIFKYVGREMARARGAIPFWKRVAYHTAPKSLGQGLSHTFNIFELGGATSDILRRTGRGIVAAYPSDLFFEYLSDGGEMRPQTMTRAAAESLVLGGAFAAGGGAFMGTKQRMRELAIGDEINFRQGLVDTNQKARFEALPPVIKRSIATYSMANPTLNYNFIESGGSNYDINTNTANINIKSTNPLKALVAHETLHHTIIKNNMEGGIAAMFLGDTKTNSAGGLFRSKSGKMDPEFESFTNRYYDRLRAGGMSDAEIKVEYPLEKVAVEYFIEQHSDQYAAMAESGELGAIAARGEVRKKLGSVLETILPKIPVLRDLHFKSGGAIDANGAFVTGVGILGDFGVSQNPIAKKMFREMNKRSSGMMPGQFEPLLSDKEGSGAPLFFDPANEIDVEMMHPMIQVDANDKPILKDGRPIALSKEVDTNRAIAGLSIIEAYRKLREGNYAPEKGEAYVDDDGEFQPGWVSDSVLTQMFAKHPFNNEQKRMIRQTNKMVKEGTGQRMVMINFPATTRNKAGKVVYKTQGATIRDTVPVAVTISKDGNILYGLMSVTKLQENIKKRAQSRRGKKLYSGNIDIILRDVQAMMDFHKKGEDSINWFAEKYGIVEADQRKKFINTMFGLLNKKEQAVLNPMLLEDGVKSSDNVYRTYRADRVSKAIPMSPDEYAAMPFSYEAVSQVRMPEQRQMPEVAVVPERFTGSKEDIDRRGKYVEPPGFFKRFNIDSYERGGRFFDASNGEDLTGKQYATGSIDVSTGKPRLFVDNISDVTKSGAKFKTNLFKQSAGWKWTSENPPSTSTIVSVEGQGKHVYSLKANFESGVELARYSEKKSEPRLRPTAYGELKLGNQVGEISIRGKLHPVYDSIGVTAKAQGSRFMPEGVDEDKFYSQLDRVITDKVPSRATPQQIINSLGEYIVTKTETIDGKDKTTVVGKFPYTDQAKAKSLASSIERGRADWSSPSKVKEEEIKWSGIDQALASLEKDGKVSKDDLLNYLRNEGRVRFEEVTLGNEQEDPQDTQERETLLKRYQELTDEFASNRKRREEGEITLEESRANAKILTAERVDLDEKLNAIASRRVKIEPKYAQYQLPGGENYREVVLAMPADFSNSQAKIDAMTNRLVEMQEEGMRYFSKAKTDPEAKAKYDAISKEYIALSKERDMLADSARRGDTGEVYTSPHFRDIPNYVAHMRTNERVDADGRPGLFVEEFQSDRHQEGRKKGYREDNKEAQMFQEYLDAKGKKRIDLERELKTQYPEWKQQYSKFESFAKNKQSLIQDQQSGRVADAPFRTTWPLQLFKRALRDAVDSGKEWVGWTTGETQAERFDLSKQVDVIDWSTTTSGIRDVWIEPKGRNGFSFLVSPEGKIRNKSGEASARIIPDGAQIEDILGKELSEKILGDEQGNLSGDGLKIGGTGMKGFYDTILPKEIGKYVSKFKGKVEKSQIGQSISREDLDMGDMSDATPAELAQLESQGKVEGKAVPIWKVSITPEMRQLAQGQMRFMPEPANPAAPNVPFKKPLSRTGAIPDIDSTLISDAVDINGFAFDRPAKVYMQHPNGERLYFNYDPAYLIKPEFKDLRKTLEGKNVIILEADRMRATGGDMGGPLHPFLRSNQVVVKGPDGKMYKAIWANMTSTFVTGTKNRWFNDDAQYALIHIMDENAHASNKRIARAINEAWKKANLSEYDQRVIAIAMQAAITSQEQSMLSTKITQANSKIKSGDLTDKQIKEYEKYIAGWLKERNSLKWTGINKDISSKISKIKTAQTRFQNKNGTKDSVDKAKANLKEYLAAKPEHLAAFNELSNKSSSFEIADNIGKTFQSRGAAIKGLLGIEAGKFNASDILSKTEDFKGGENMDIVGAVQLSKNKDIFAVYFGNDPKEEAAMSDSERQVRDKLRADPSFVEHEAFDWMMLGPENADNFIAESSLKPEELLPDYRSKHPKASVKEGSEETVLGAMKKNAEIPLSVKKYTPAQIKQIQKNRKAWIEDRKAKEARKKQVQSLKAKIKQRDASITKLDKMLSVANEAEASAIVAKQSKAESEKKELADQIKTLQNLK